MSTGFIHGRSVQYKGHEIVVHDDHDVGDIWLAIAMVIPGLDTVLPSGFTAHGVTQEEAVRNAIQRAKAEIDSRFP